MWYLMNKSVKLRKIRAISTEGQFGREDEKKGREKRENRICFEEEEG